MINLLKIEPIERAYHFARRATRKYTTIEGYTICNGYDCHTNVPLLSLSRDAFRTGVAPLPVLVIFRNKNVALKQFFRFKDMSYFTISTM